MIRVLLITSVLIASPAVAGICPNAPDAPTPDGYFSAGALSVYCDLKEAEAKALAEKERMAIRICACRDIKGGVTILGPDNLQVRFKLKAEDDVQYILGKLGTCRNYE